MQHNLQEEAMDAKAKYAKAINDYLGHEGQGYCKET